jgi:hypothetical protein
MLSLVSWPDSARPVVSWPDLARPVVSWPDLVRPVVSWPDLVRPVVSWPDLVRPSTTCGACGGKVVDGRHKAGHDTTGAAPGYDTGRDARAAGCQRPPAFAGACFAAMTLKRRGRVGPYPP